MLSAICFNLDQSKILSSGNGSRGLTKLKIIVVNLCFFCSQDPLPTLSGMVQNSGDGTDPTLTELMKTMYDGASQRQLM